MAGPHSCIILHNFGKIHGKLELTHLLDLTPGSIFSCLTRVTSEQFCFLWSPTWSWSPISDHMAHWSVQEEILGKTVLTCTPGSCTGHCTHCTCGEHGVYTSIPLGLLCPKHCLLWPIVKITHSQRETEGGEKNYNWKIILSTEKIKENQKCIKL